MAVKINALIKNGFKNETGFFIENTNKIIETVLYEHFFIERGVCETDASYKQIIPYVTVRRADKLLLLKRLRSQNEKRLHGLLSIGLGGHINETDINVYGKNENIIINGMHRELNEEISIGYSKAPEFIGIINDNSNDVGKVHLGFWFIIDADSEAFSINELEKTEGRWIAKNELQRLTCEMETWSSLLLNSKYLYSHL